jgi:diphosphomevalonate decarboxylase
VLVIVSHDNKKISSTDGMEGISTSPYWKDRIKRIPYKIQKIQEIFQEKNFQKLGELIEEDCLDMHHVMQTQNPPLFYWNEVTRRIMDAVIEWRKQGVLVYFTIDAGPNIHLICEKEQVKNVIKRITTIDGVELIIVNSVSEGTHCINTHLF